VRNTRERKYNFKKIERPTKNLKIIHEANFAWWPVDNIHFAYLGLYHLPGALRRWASPSAYSSEFGEKLC
jgi:hypothetical protein